jgi:hypothetical protein
MCVFCDRHHFRQWSFAALPIPCSENWSCCRGDHWCRRWRLGSGLCDVEISTAANPTNERCADSPHKKRRLKPPLLKLTAGFSGRQSAKLTPINARVKLPCSGSATMRKVLRGYAKDRSGNLILIGTMPVAHSKDKPSPSERQARRHLISQGATIFKKERVQ